MLDRSDLLLILKFKELTIGERNQPVRICLGGISYLTNWQLFRGKSWRFNIEKISIRKILRGIVGYTMNSVSRKENASKYVKCGIVLNLSVNLCLVHWCVRVKRVKPPSCGQSKALMTITCSTILYSHAWEKGVIWQLRLRPQFLAQSAFATYKS